MNTTRTIAKNGNNEYFVITRCHGVFISQDGPFASGEDAAEEIAAPAHMQQASVANLNRGIHEALLCKRIEQEAEDAYWADVDAFWTPVERRSDRLCNEYFGA